MSTNTSSKSSTRNKHFDSNSSSNAQSIDITKEEFSRISDALKNEEFRKLFLDYCEEIQDPSNRQRYEDEIKQLEAERGVDVTFINPEPGFVIKTSVDGSLKCFVNVAKSTAVAKPTSEACLNSDTGNRGLSWAIPLAQAAPRDDLDANGKRCRVFDVVFHPDALYLAEKNVAFRKCLVDTALDAVEREYKVKLDRTNLKFPKLQFKGVARPTVIRKLAKNAPPEAYEPHPLDGIYPEKPSKDSAEPKVIPLKTKSTEKPEYTTPKYTIKYRRDVDLAEFTNELDAKLDVTVPRELVVEIELPLLSSTADSQLDVTSKSLYFLSEKAGAKYRLKLDLPQVVDDKKGKARFEADTRRLCISLPVVQRSTLQQRDMHETLMHLNREDSGVESDVRDDMHSNSESPVEELSDGLDDDAVNGSQEKKSSAMQSAAKQGAFLKSSIHYQFPTKFDCNVLDNVMSFVLHVRNVQPESISTQETENTVHVQFMSVGSGYYPTHYAFYLHLPSGCDFKIMSVEPEAWENNVVLNINLAETSENLTKYLAGLDSNDLKEYTVQGKFPVLHDSRQRKKLPSIPSQMSLSSSLDISIERSECEKTIEIEIKPRDLENSTCVATTTEDEESQQKQQQQVKKMNKKQKKKNKKRRSLSESTYDDIKAYEKNQQELENQQTNHNLSKASVERSTENNGGNNEGNENVELPEMVTRNISASMVVPTTTAQQRKQRSYSECRHSVVSSDGGLHSFKGILKHYSRYEPRPSISDSSSSIDECLSLSCSTDACAPNSLRFSQSFTDIPEENATELSESCKKTVRFNDVIQRQVFRLHSSILGQRKKNQKRRIQKQRALQRRLSEGDSVDYEDMKPDFDSGKSKTDANRGKCGKPAQHDSGLDLSQGKNNKNEKSCKNGRHRFESESSSDVDTNKTSMMFEMDM